MVTEFGTAVYRYANLRISRSNSGQINHVIYR